MSVIFTNNKLKTTLGEQTKARRKHLEHETSLLAIAASKPNSVLGEMKLERRKLSELKNLPRRVRKSEKPQVKSVATSLRTFRQSAPILITASNEIINGHVVAQAMRILGEEEIWCAVVDHLSAHERDALHIALNRIGETGVWDLELLGPLLVDLGSAGLELETTGFTIPELEILVGPAVIATVQDEPEELLEPAPAAISVYGDLWHLDDSRVLCGDATKPESYAKVLAGRNADVVFTDAPWNIPIEGFVSGLGKIKHKNFKNGAGEMSDEEFAAFIELSHALAAGHLKPGSVFFSCIDWRSSHIVVAAGCKANLRHINTVVWNKGSGGMGTPYRSAHEFVVVFCKGDKILVNNVELGKHGRDRTNVWPYPGANRRGSSAAQALLSHPTPKPIELVEDALKDVSNPGALVLDPFLGSGTTVLAAERSGRVACGVELDPIYVDVAIRRWEALTGKRAIHAETGMTFEEVGTERSALG